jgi:hypothetical protein
MIDARTWDKVMDAETLRVVVDDALNVAVGVTVTVAVIEFGQNSDR